MKVLLTIAAVLGLLAAGAYFGYPYLQKSWKTKPNYRRAAVTRGEIVYSVTSTGTIQPVRRVQVGSFVSGPILELLVDFNSHVTKGQLMAKIDPQIQQANVARDEATRASAKAEVKRVAAQLEQAAGDERRSRELRGINEKYISEAEIEQFRCAREALEAQLDVAKAAVGQAESALKMSQASLKYTDIEAPEDGDVIDRKVDKGQTVAASFQTPELFVIAPDMDKFMLVLASVDEADIGHIQGAKLREEPVQFTVDAHPDDLFEGRIDHIRLNPTTLQNVVTYTVVVKAPNPERKLLPGMTANLSFRIARRADIVKVPNAALRFYPKLEQVRPDDRKLLEGEQEKEEEKKSTDSQQRSATDRISANRERSRRHGWIEDGDFLRAVEITTGLSDSHDTELVSGDLQDGQQLVTGVSTARP